MGNGAWVFFLEAGAAMALLVAIVWWTMLSTPDRAKRPLRAPPKDSTESTESTETTDIANTTETTATPASEITSDAKHPSPDRK